MYGFQSEGHRREREIEVGRRWICLRLPAAGFLRVVLEAKGPLYYNDDRFYCQTSAVGDRGRGESMPTMELRQ